MQNHLVLKPSTNASLTVSTTAVSLSTPPTDATGGIMVVELGDVRMTWDGTAPVASGNGIPMVTNSVWEITGRDLFTGMQFIRDTSTDAKVSVIYVSGQ